MAVTCIGGIEEEREAVCAPLTCESELSPASFARALREEECEVGAEDIGHGGRCCRMRGE